MKQIDKFEQSIDKMFAEKSVTKAQLLDAFHKANPNSLSLVKELNLACVTNWVAIDTLPQVECFYLVYDRTYGMITKALFTKDEFHCIENLEDLEITHWCNLPKPPCL